MAIKNYSAAAETLIQLSGGKENFITVENCATRVRIQYKDLSKVDKKAIGEMDGVLSVIEKDGLQVVVGPGVCNKLCAAINEILSVDRAASTAAPDAPDAPDVISCAGRKEEGRLPQNHQRHLRSGPAGYDRRRYRTGSE